MDYRYKQLEQELSALSKVFSELGIRLSEVAKEVTSPGLLPSEKILEQISASRASFDSARNAVHGHAGAMLVSPLPVLGELVSITAIDTLLNASAAAEENKFWIEGEREKALAILERVLSITHKDGEFKPLQDCHAKLGDLRSAVSGILWPHRHPDSANLVAAKHPSTALLNFVENLDALDDEKWMALEATISESYGKPLFVAASRGKLAVREVTTETLKTETPLPAPKPVAAAPAPAPLPALTPAKAPTPAPEAVKPVAVAAAEKPAEKPVEKPIEKKIAAEKAPEKPAPAPAVQATVVPATPVVVTNAPAAAPVAVSDKKVSVHPPAPAPAAAASAEKKEIAPEKAVSKSAVATPAAPAISSEKKEVVEKPHPAPAPAPVTVASVAIPVAAPPAPAAAHSPISVSPITAVPAHPVPAPVAAASAPIPAPVAAAPMAPPRPPAAAPVAAAPAAVPVQAMAAPAAPPVPAAVPVAAHNAHPAPTAAVPQNVTNSLAALATATEPAVEKRTAVGATVEVAEKQRKEPRLATPVVQMSPKTEPKAPEMAPEEAQQGAAGDASQRPQRWGFWRGNR